MERIGFGSCLQQWKPQPVWEAVLDQRPDLFVFTGDSVYADYGPQSAAPEPERIRLAYQTLDAQSGFRALRERLPVYATWDDHDYGLDDAGGDYPWKGQSQRLFLDFFRAPAHAPQRHRPGVYSAHLLGEPGRRVQIILLDTRYFRSPARKTSPSVDCPFGGHEPNEDPAATMLGEAQWAWLAERLRDPAELRILVSSIQVIPDRHCFEKWANFPRERERLLRLIHDSGAGGLVLVSGDRHLAEISRLPAERIGYPLYEITASGMNSAFGGWGEDNPYRTTSKAFGGDNFGLIRIAWQPPGPAVTLEVHDVAGNRVALAETLPLARLRPPGR